MNYLFYLGIIAPTLITILLFVIFVYCWFLQKARKEVLTKKYDPHGKMRRLGIPMDPPLPPAYCRINDHAHFLDNGEDNQAYDVSRSPSTEQDQRGRPLYHTYHDSGISAGLSPSQENEPRPGLSYRTCPDSGISGFSIQTPGSGSQQHICRGCCQAREQMPPLHHQSHLQHQQPITRPHYLPQQHQQVVLHHNTVQASVHPAHGVCYGDEMTHPQSPQHYNPPPLQTSTFSIVSPTAYSGRHFTTMPHIHEQPSQAPSASGLSQGMCYCSDGPDYQSPDGPDIQPCCPEEGLDSFLQVHSLNPPLAYPSTFRPQNPRTMALMSSSMAVTSSPQEDSIQPESQTTSSKSSLHQKQPDTSPSHNSCLPHGAKVANSSPATKPPRHSTSTRDSGVLDLGQSTNANDRPDSQASTSSTTDSEDSGFRSSHCAAHHTSNLSKHGHPLLKPMRRPKNTKTRPKSTRGGVESHDVQGATPLSTLNAQKLQYQVASNAKPHLIQTTSLADQQEGQQSPPRILQQQHAVKSPLTSFSDTHVHNSVPNYQNENSLGHSPVNGSNQDSAPRQHPEASEISTHLSWKYLQDLSVSSNSSHDSCNSQDGLQLCHTGVNNEPQFPQEPQLEMFSYSVV